MVALNPRSQLLQILNLLYIVTSAYMFWKGLSVVTNSSSPIVVVLSGSMEPAFQRGDILFLNNNGFGNSKNLLTSPKQQKVGDVVVYEIPGKPIPIVHRVLREHHDATGHQRLLTKGDNNPVDDLGLYNRGQNYLKAGEVGRDGKEGDVVGTVWGYFPIVGYITILLTENQYFKYGLLGLMVVSSLFSNE